MTQEQPRLEHAVIVDMATCQVGENIFSCTQCGQPIHLLFDGQSFSLRLTDSDNPDFGTVSIEIHPHSLPEINREG